MNRKPIPYIIVVCIAALVWSSCKDIMEPSLSKRSITSLAPANNYQSASYSINFWWEEVEDALTYRLQVVTPDFTSVSGLVLDTVVKTNKFVINLRPGNYEWHVQAVNGSSRTSFSIPKSFTVLLGSIKGQSVQLTSPANNTVTNQSSVVFQWGSLYGATKYHLQVDTNSFANEAKLVYDQVLPAQQFNFTFLKDHTYQWRVRAENDTANAQWSSVNTVSYDRTPPGQVILVSPGKDQQVSLPIALQWNTVSTATRYKLYVYKSDSTTVYNNTFPMLLNTTSHSFNLGAFGERIYWKVSAIDGAGNEGKVSSMRNFVLK